MKVKGGKITEKIVNKQFEMIGEDMTFEQIPDNGIIQVGKKGIMWYDHYKFTEEQETEWREWAKEQLDSEPWLEVGLPIIELLYGFIRRYKKEGELF